MNDTKYPAHEAFRDLISAFPERYSDPKHIVTRMLAEFDSLLAEIAKTPVVDGELVEKVAMAIWERGNRVTRWKDLKPCARRSQVLADAKAAISALPVTTRAVGEWQDIATAPKDGSSFLACKFEDYSNRVCKLYTPDNGIQDVPLADHYIIVQLRWDFDEDKHVEVICGEDWSSYPYVTHWQPLPLPPQPQNKE